MLNTNQLSLFIKKTSKSLGFDDAGICKAEKLSEDEIYLKNWIKAKAHAGLHYMEDHIEKRVNPTLLFEGTQSIVVVLLNYFSEKYPFKNSPLKIARYALGKDYHIVVKDKLNKLLKKIIEVEPQVKGRAFVDSSQVLEKALARKAGLGWIGKNGLLISKQHGSFCFIGELFLNIELKYNKQIENDRCRNCKKCIDACPTQALVEPRILDARKCIAYHTIESHEPIPINIKKNLSVNIFGCDICQDICPWNNMTKSHHISEFEPLESIRTLSKKKLLSMKEEEFNEIFSKSSLKRTGYKGILKNLA